VCGFGLKSFFDPVDKFADVRLYELIKVVFMDFGYFLISIELNT